jgi:hypothetical protein
VRVAVSTISLAADSIADVSYAFSRILILFWLAAAILNSWYLSCGDVKRASGRIHVSRIRPGPPWRVFIRRIGLQHAGVAGVGTTR